MHTMKLCPSAAAMTSATELEGAENPCFIERPGPVRATGSPSSHSSSLRPSSAPSTASHGEPRLCTPAVADCTRVSDTIPCFASITLEEASVCDSGPGADATEAHRNSGGEGSFQASTEEKGLLFLGTGVSCALPQLAHVLPIADPGHPFHPYIHVPIEKLPSTASLHRLGAAHNFRQGQQLGHVEGDQQTKHSAAPGSPERPGHLSSRSSHVGIKAFELPLGEEHLRHSGQSLEALLPPKDTVNEDANAEVHTAVPSNGLCATGDGECASQIRSTKVSAGGSSRNQTGCSSESACRSSGTAACCTGSDTSTAEGTQDNAMGAGHNDGMCSRSTRRSCRRSFLPKAVHEAYPSCRFRCQAGECLQEDPQPAPACVSCFMSWKSAQDPNNRGNVCAVLKLGEGKTVLIDCGKTFRQAALAFCPRYGIRSLNAVLLTHDHQDAVGGLDDLRDMQRFCRPPYRKEALVGQGSAHGLASTNSAAPESTQTTQGTFVAAKEEANNSSKSQQQLLQHGQPTVNHGQLLRHQRHLGEHIHNEHKVAEKATVSHPRDTLGYRPCYTLNCFLGVRTYKTICIRYGYIVEASSRMSAWVLAAREQQKQQSRFLQNGANKIENENANFPVEGHTDGKQEGGGGGSSNSITRAHATAMLAKGLSDSNKKGEGDASIRKQKAEEDEDNVPCSLSQVKRRREMQVENVEGKEVKVREGGVSCLGARDCESSGTSAMMQSEAPMCFPCSPLDPGWAEAPVFERKVACLAFHLLSDEAPVYSTSGDGEAGGLLTLCQNNTARDSGAVSEKVRTSCSATSVAEAESAAVGQQEGAHTSQSSNARRPDSSAANGASASLQTAGKRGVASASTQRQLNEEIAALPIETISQDTAYSKKEGIEKEEKEQVAIESGGESLRGKDSSGQVVEKETWDRERELYQSASSITKADAAGFCEVCIPGTNTKLVSFPMFHGGTYVCLGYVIGTREKLLYMSDVKEVPLPVLQRLKSIGDLHTLVIDALSEKLHNSHLSIQEALTMAVELQPRHVYFVGMTCTLEHDQTNRRLRCWLQRHRESYRFYHGGRESRLSHVALAYDGMFLPINF